MIERRSVTIVFIQQNGMVSNETFLNLLKGNSHQWERVKGSGRDKDYIYLNISAGFDIESTSFYDESNPPNKVAIMYHWQIGIDGIVTSGRAWPDYQKLLSAINQQFGLSWKSERLVIYVHNLPYEFQFMRKWFDWSDVFMLDNRKIVRCTTGPFEYRCSLKLAGGRSLKSVGDNLNKYIIRKMAGDLDYSLIRHSKTPLTEKELKYCENDVRVVMSYIQEKIETDGDITKIPLTNTGYVRRFVKEKMFETRVETSKLMKTLTMTPQEFLDLRQAFQGGFVHGNVKYIGKTVKHVMSMDISSSYPAVILLKKFPMSKLHTLDKIDNEKQLQYLLKNKCCLFTVKLTTLTPKVLYANPIASSKVVKGTLKGATINNGKVVSADELTITITEQDFFTIDEFYSFESIEIIRFGYYDVGYLPKNIHEAVGTMYKGKTELKGVEGSELEYMVLKNMLNSNYGMMVMNPIRDEYYYVPQESDSVKEWTDEDGSARRRITKNGYAKQNPNLIEAIEAYNTDKNRFLFYPWGVWITAYARRNLFKAIKAVGEDFVYCDTDSVKFMNPESHTEWFEEYNREILEGIKLAQKYTKLDGSYYMPKGKTIGIFDFDGLYRRFRTLGAKRYFVEYENKKHKFYKVKGKRYIPIDGNALKELTVNVQKTRLAFADNFAATVSGMRKANCRDYLVETGSPFDSFTSDLTVPATKSGRNLLTYIDEPRYGEVVDYLGNRAPYMELSGIHMESMGYEFSQSKDFERYIQGIQNPGPVR